MPEQAARHTAPADPVGRVLHHTSVALAVFGGVLCAVMALLVTASVIGRYLFAAPVPGDYDIIGIMNGVAVFAFLPYCQLVRGNVVVDFFTARLRPRGKALLDAAGNVLFLVVAVVFTWRMYYGLLDLRDYSEVIAAFNFYRWWTVPLNLFCMLVLIAVIGYTLARDIARLRIGAAPPAAKAQG